jgi:hypothetical protein
MFLFKLPDGVGAIENVEVKRDSIEFQRKDARPEFSISARGAEAFLSGGASA